MDEEHYREFVSDDHDIGDLQRECAMAEESKTYPCETCGLRKRAEEKPDSFIAKLWRWHTGWCPGWKAYQLALAEAQSNQPEG
jgi:hypothetical protein